MKQQIIVRKAFGLPGGVKGIGGKLLAVHMDGNLLSPGGVIRMDIAREIALNPAALIVIGTPAFLSKFTADLKAVEKELAHIVSDAFKIFDKLLIVGHDAAFLKILKCRCDS